MSGTALCGCFVEPFHPLVPPSVVIRDGAGVAAFRGMTPPPGVDALYRAIAGVVCIGALPLLWLESAGGRGGFFRGDLVAVGEADVRSMTGAILGRLGALRAPVHEVYAAVVRVLIAHEVGHAVQARLGTLGAGPACEGEADLTAGWIAASLGWPERDDALVLDAAGAPGPSSHPSGPARVQAYREGRRLRRAAA